VIVVSASICCDHDRLSDEVKAEFKSLGSTYISRLAMRDAWAFVGQYGLQGRSTIEEVLYCDSFCFEHV